MPLLLLRVACIVRVQLGSNNRAMVYAHPLRSGGAPLTAVELEVLSQEVVIGVLAVSIAEDVVGV